MVLHSADLGFESSDPRAHLWLSEVLAGWQEKFPDVLVVPRVMADFPVDGLITRSHGQRVLIIGSGGR